MIFALSIQYLYWHFFRAEGNLYRNKTFSKILLSVCVEQERGGGGGGGSHGLL